MPAWFITNTTYGTWLPGDPRGSVTSVRDRRPTDPASALRIEHDRFGDPVEAEMPGLYRSALEQMNGEPIYLQLEHAELILAQFQETAEHRGWTLCAVSIMRNHFHLVVNAADQFKRERIRADFKAYASRKLDEIYGMPPSETWWTSKGSVRRLGDDRAFAAAIQYVIDQEFPLLVWVREKGRLV